MNTVQIDWYDAERDLDTALAEFAESWDVLFEIKYDYDTDYQGKDLIVVTVQSPVSMREFEELVEGPNGLLDHLNDWTSRGVDVSYRYL